MKLSDLEKNERIVDSEGKAVTFGATMDLVQIWYDLPERTPEALWLAVDDHWRQTFVLVDNIMWHITPAQLFETAQHYGSQAQQTSEKISKSVSVQTQGIAKLMTATVDGRILSAAAGDKASILAALNTLDTKEGLYQALTSHENVMRSLADGIQAKAVEAMSASMGKLPPAQKIYVPSFGNLETTLGALGVTATGFVAKEMAYQNKVKEACAILEIWDNPDDHYDNLSDEQFWNEVAAVRWLKETAQKGRIQSPEAILHLGRLLSEGKLSYHTLERFKDRLIGQPQAAKPTLYAVTIDDSETAEILHAMLQNGELNKQRLLDLKHGRIATVADTAKMLDEHLNRLFPSGDILLAAQQTQSDDLTEREKEIARLLAQCLNDKQIAEALCISEGTVKVHRRNIVPKWEMNTQDIKAMQNEARRRRYGRG